MLSFLRMSLLLKFKDEFLHFFSPGCKVAFGGWPDFFSIIEIRDSPGSEQRIISISGLIVAQDDKGLTERLEILSLGGGINRLKQFVVGFENLLWCGT
jgi:hypothetical protein